MTTQTVTTLSLAESIKRLARTTLSVLETRLALLQLDLQEARAQAVNLLIVAALAAVSLALAFILVVFFVVALFWDNRLVASGALIILFAGGGIGMWAWVSRKAREAKTFLAATRAELMKDKEQLTAREEPASGGV